MQAVMLKPAAAALAGTADPQPKGSLPDTSMQPFAAEEFTQYGRSVEPLRCATSLTMGEPTVPLACRKLMVISIGLPPQPLGPHAGVDLAAGVGQQSCDITHSAPQQRLPSLVAPGVPGRHSWFSIEHFQPWHVVASGTATPQSEAFSFFSWNRWPTEYTTGERGAAVGGAVEAATHGCHISFHLP
jgi:hypothetical protein